MTGCLLYRVGMDWQRLADVIRGELAKRGWTQQDLADRAGIDIKTVSLLLNAHPRSRLPRTIPQIEAALNWEPGSARAVLEGGEPTQVEPVAWSSAPAPHNGAERAAARFWRAARRVQSGLLHASQGTRSLSDAAWLLPKEDLQEALQAIRRYHEHAQVICDLLGVTYSMLEDLVAQASSLLVDGEPLTDIEERLYKAMLDTHGEHAAAQVVRTYRQAQRNRARNENTRSSVSPQRRPPDISQIRRTHRPDGDDLELDVT